VYWKARLALIDGSGELSGGKDAATICAEVAVSVVSALPDERAFAGFC
jgi:hypothetical protein